MNKIESIDQVKDALKKDGICFGVVNPNKYHEWKKELPNSVSKSSLVDFASNPYAFRWAQLEGEKRASSAMRQGSMLDCLVLTPELFAESYVVEDINRRTKDGKARAQALEAEGKQVVAPAEYDDLRRAAQVANKAIHAIAAGNEVLTQVAIWSRITELCGESLPAPLTVSGMFDILFTDGVQPHIVDLKSSSINLNSDEEVTRNICSFKYGLQAAMYCDLFRAAFGSDPCFSLLYLSTNKPFQTRQVHFSEGDIEVYRQRYLMRLLDFSECCASDFWGDAHLSDMFFSMPHWELNK